MIEYLRLFRVSDWTHILGLTILGYVYATDSVIFPQRLLASLLISILYLAWGYSINECFDKGMGPRAILLSCIVFFINLILASIYSWEIVLLVLFGGLMGFLYSVPPIRLKQIPFLGLFCNSLCFTPLFLIGYATVKNLDLTAFLMAIFIFFLFLPIDLIHQLNDFNEDSIKNIRTTAVACGILKTLILITISLIILNFWALILSWYQKVSYYLFFLTLFFSIWIIVYLFRRFIEYGNDTNKYKIKLNMRYLFVCYGIALFIIFYFKL